MAKKLGDAAPPKLVPKTIDSEREKDKTTITGDDIEELEREEGADAYSGYYNKLYEPKILVTSSDNPHQRTINFIRELCRMMPGAEPTWRRLKTVEKTVKVASEKGFTDLIIINEDKRAPNGMLLIHLPEGPSAMFRISNPRVCKDLHKKHTDITDHRPEVILSNFKTRLGRIIARMLGALFHHEPEFKGRRVVTFHTQRDYIFFRHHRYEFKDTTKVKIKELGPRFTLKLQWLQEGAFTGDYEWILKRHQMETSRRKFSL